MKVIPGVKPITDKEGNVKHTIEEINVKDKNGETKDILPDLNIKLNTIG